MRIALVTMLFSIGLFAFAGCDSQGGSEPEKTSMSEIDQFLADNPDHAAQQLAVEEAAETEEDADAAVDE